MLNKSVISFLLSALLLLSSLPLAAQTETPDVLPDNVPGLLGKANEA